MSKRAYVYIDGFNLYNGAVKNKPYYKWLDLVKFSKSILYEDTVSKVKYFTANVLPMGDKQRPDRQKAYLTALTKLYPDIIQIIKGSLRVYPNFLPIAKMQYKVEHYKMNKATNNYIWVMKPEEKGTDVNLAVHLVRDSLKNIFDIALVISNDSDLKEAIWIARKEGNKKIYIANPHLWKENKCHIDLKRVSTREIKINVDLLGDCQLPESIPGTKISRPDKWK